jgi:hypothetical protein
MRAVKRKEIEEPLSSTTEVLLSELREECDRVSALIRRLETKPGSEKERDEILGELSAAVFHLHTHTAGLDEFLCEAQ